MGDRETSERERALLLVRGLEERGVTASVQGSRVAVRVGARAETLQRALFPRLPHLPVEAADGRLLLDIHSISEDDIPQVARAVAAELRSAEGFVT